MTEKPFLKLTSKDFLTGLANGAHVGSGGLFFKADGVTALVEPGKNQSTLNGLLMPAPIGTTISGALNGTPIASAKVKMTTPSSVAYFYTTTGHIFSLALDTGFATSLSDVHTVASPRQGFEVFTKSNGGQVLFYMQDTHIGMYDFSTFTDSWDTVSSDSIHCTHLYFDRLLYGNSQNIGSIDGSLVNTKNALDTSWPLVTDISDDGIYAAIAVTDNLVRDANAVSNTAVIFWDGFSSSWLRQYSIPDPYIISLQKTAGGVFAFGVTGIWHVSFFGGARKVFNRSTGMYTSGTYTNLMYGTKNASFYDGALLWGASSGSNTVVKSLGQLDIGSPSANLHPFLGNSGKNITLVDGQLLKGYVFVGDDTPSLMAYPFSTANSCGTGVTAQTAYFSLPNKTSVKRIDVIFGQPLASGDSVTVGLYTDEATAAIPYGTATYAANGAIRRKPFFGKARPDEQLSFYATFNSGAVKIKAVEFYGDAEAP